MILTKWLSIILIFIGILNFSGYFVPNEDING